MSVVALALPMSRALSWLAAAAVLRPLAATQLSRVDFGSAHVSIEQEFSGAEEGSVIWDASRSLLAHVTFLREQPAGAEEELIADKRLIEVGSGTGVVGLALARLGARSVIMTDKASQMPLLRRNLQHNEPECCGVSCAELCWSASWQSECDPSLTAPGAFDTIICADCVYPDRPSELATVLIDLLELNPKATLLLAAEKRPPPEGAPEDTDHQLDFFARMRAECDVEPVPEGQIDPRWACDEITLWRMRARL